MEYIIIIIGAIFVNNIILAQFLGVCPFLGVSNTFSTAIGMGVAVLFVMALSTIVTFLIHKYVLLPYNVVFLQTVTFILIIASLVQIGEIILKKTSPVLYQALGIFLPLITTNCAVLGVAILVTQKPEFANSLLNSVLHASALGLGFLLAIIIFAGLRSQLELVDIPKGMQGVPISLITVGILALAFMGFANLV